MPRTPLSLVLDYRQAGKIALNVLVGALETCPDTAAVPVVFVPRERDLAAELARALDASDRVLALWSFYSPDAAEQARRLADVRARVSDPRVTHVVGGVHATAEPLRCLRDGWDLVAVGEGERTIVDLVRAALASGDLRPALREVRGTAHLDATGGLVQRGRGDVVTLDDWPPFAPGHGRLGPIELTRGCIYACGFCQTPFMNRARFRHRSLENVLRWVRVQKVAGFRDYRFITPTSLSYGGPGPDPDLAAVEALLRGVREVIGPSPGARLFYGTFPSEVRPEHVTPEAMALLRRYVDNTSLIIGGQSGSDRVLARTHRGHDVAAVERAVTIALAAGFEPHVDFIFGLPGEEPDDVEATLRLAEGLAAHGARVHGHTFMPLPGTPLKDAPPGRLDPATRARLDRLAAGGGLYGQWARQEELAQDLGRARISP